MTYGAPQWREWGLEEEAPLIRRALKAYLPRHEAVIATKAFNPMSEAPNDRGLSRRHIMESIDASLMRLGAGYVDLYQIHRWDDSVAALSLALDEDEIQSLEADSVPLPVPLKSVSQPQ